MSDYIVIVSPVGRRRVRETVQAESIEAAQAVGTSMAARLGTTHVTVTLALPTTFVPHSTMPVCPNVGAWPNWHR